MKTQESIDPTVEELYVQTLNEGGREALADQNEALEELANEAGTTIEELEAARLARQEAAAKRMKINSNVVAGPNDGDDWRRNEDRPDRDI